MAPKVSPNVHSGHGDRSIHSPPDVGELFSQAPGGLHPHALRHTAASLAIASGANVKVVQQMLGHKSATMTLDLYGHLFPDQLDEVADRLDAAARAVVYPLCTRPDPIPISVA